LKLNDIFTAVQLGNLKFFHYLVHVRKRPVDVLNHGNHQSPLQVAVENNNMKMVEALIQHGASVGFENGRGQNALHTAVENKKKEIFFYLLEKVSDNRVLSLRISREIQI
jgi:ankyrin repeat protein